MRPHSLCVNSLIRNRKMSLIQNIPALALGLAIATTSSLAVAADTHAAQLAATRDSPVGQSLPSGDDEIFQNRMLSWSAPAQPRIVVTENRFSEDSGSLSRLHISSGFGWRSDPFRGGRGRHDGIDLPAPTGVRVMATGPGIVRVAGWAHGYGNMIEIEHSSGVRTRYGHLSRIHVFPGQHVRQGELIGDVGSTGRSTGSHLHYEIRVNGTPVDPLHLADHGETVRTVWTAEIRAKPRWAGWGEGNAAADSLPEPQIR